MNSCEDIYIYLTTSTSQSTIAMYFNILYKLLEIADQRRGEQFVNSGLQNLRHMPNLDFRLTVPQNGIDCARYEQHKDTDRLVSCFQRCNG